MRQLSLNGAPRQRRLELALQRARSGDQVWVAEGTYRPSPLSARAASIWSREGFEVPPGVWLFGGFDGTESSLLERAGLFETTVPM